MKKKIRSSEDDEEVILISLIRMNYNGKRGTQIFEL